MLSKSYSDNIPVYVSEIDITNEVDEAKLFSDPEEANNHGIKSFGEGKFEVIPKEARLVWAN